MKFRFGTYNTAAELIRVEEGYVRESHPEWRVNNRISSVLKKIIEMNVDVLNLQELRTTLNKYDEIVDSINPLKNHLESMGYKVLVQPYNNSSDKAAQFITAFKKDKFTLITAKFKYFTKTPDQVTVRPNIEGKSLEEIKLIDNQIKDNNFGVLFERGTFITHLKHIETNQELINKN